MAQETVLEIKNLEVKFPQLGKTVQANRGCSITVRKKEILALVGESGSGKSTLALAALKMVPAPGVVTGSVKVAGNDVNNLSVRELEKFRGGTAAMIFQEPTKALNPFFKVGFQMADAIGRQLGISRKKARAAAVKAMQSVYLPDAELLLNKYPHQMSGGQLQRVMISMALACEPTLLIADEPTSALDVTVQAQIILLLRELAAQKDISILFITHDLGVVSALCDRVAVMYAGKIVESGPVNKVMTEPVHPYTKNLLKTVPRHGRGKKELNYIKGQVPDMAFPPDGCAFHLRCDKAGEICMHQPPGLYKASNGHEVYCHNISEDRKCSMTNGRKVS